MDPTQFGMHDHQREREKEKEKMVNTHCLGRIVSSDKLRWVKDVCVLGVTCHLHLWQNDRDLLRAIAITWE